MIRVGQHVKPLSPMRDARQICIDALAAIRGGISLTGAHVRGLVEFGHPNGQDRACEAVAILAHLCADRNPNALKEVFATKQAEEKARFKTETRALAKRMQTLDEIMDAIHDERDRVRAAGGVFTVSDIRPIIEKALS